MRVVTLVQRRLLDKAGLGGSPSGLGQSSSCGKSRLSVALDSTARDLLHHS